VPPAVYKLGYVLGEAARFAAKGATALSRGDFGRIAAFVRRTLRHDPTVAGRKG